MEPREEGFEQSDNEQVLPSKLTDNKEENISNAYFAVPDAKPILSKNFIDYNKPKVLIREVEFIKEPTQLQSSIHKDLFSQDKNHNLKQYPSLKNVELTSIWNKYVMVQNYKILYLKYFKEDISELQGKGFKKFKLELQKLCRHEQNLFSTYIVDLSFLTDVGTYLLRNLKEVSLEQLRERPFPESDQIKFDSRFECGNLFAAFESKTANQTNKQSLEYDLILQSDINSKGYSNWFYFSVQTRRKCTIKFNIVNMQKTHTLFTKGMKAAFFSAQKLQKQKIGWHRDGYNYGYYRNQLLKNTESNITYNTLTFQYESRYENDLVFIAANLPYSYSRMLAYVESIEKIARLNPSIYFKKQSIAATISSNQCPVITLTWKRDHKKDKVRRKKKIIGVIARQHPSETVSSFVMEGFINSLVYLNEESSMQLLQNYIFKIVPMVNIDGVIYGNSRCDITGSDINRKWTRHPNKFLYPVISQIRSLFLRLSMEQYEIDYFIDLHGHSRKLGSFIYGCKGFDDLQARQTAWIMSRFNPKFIFEESTFGLSAYKKQTARGIMSDIVIKKKSMTLETSFYGYRTITNKHFEVKDLHKMGATIIEAIHAQVTRDPKMFNWETIRAQIIEAIAAARSARGESKKEKEGLTEEESSGSDSDPEVDEMNNKERAELFLDPATASKIGLNEVKVVEKSKKTKKEENEQKNTKYELILDGFNEKMDLDMFPQKSSIYEPFKTPSEDRLKQKEKKFVIRETRSTTKILPFKLSERNEKSNEGKMIKTRKSVDAFLHTRSQRLSVPDLPEVKKKNNFWSNLKKEYEGILLQKKMGIGKNKLF